MRLTPSWCTPSPVTYFLIGRDFSSLHLSVQHGGMPQGEKLNNGWYLYIEPFICVHVCSVKDRGRESSTPRLRAPVMMYYCSLAVLYVPPHLWGKFTRDAPILGSYSRTHKNAPIPLNGNITVNSRLRSGGVASCFAPLSDLLTRNSWVGEIDRTSTPA